MRLGRRSGMRLIGAALLAGMIAGCASMTFPWLTSSYYGRGPEAALKVLDVLPVAGRDAVLATMEEAMIRLELGDYQHSRESALRGLGWLDGGAGAAPAPPDFFRGESFERVWLATVALLDSLARQDLDLAAGDADDVLDRIRASGCGACAFAFSRWTAAIALEQVGRIDEARAAVADAVRGEPDQTFLLGELVRLGGLPDLGEGLQVMPGPDASRAEAGPRELVVLLLLGVRPDKVDVRSHRGKNGPGVRFAPSGWDGGEIGVVATDTGEVYRAVVLTDMAVLAEASLEARRGDAKDDLRQWSTLPATCQAVRVALAGTARWAEVTVVDGDGQTVSEEIVELPPKWRSGPLFVVRRVP
jgi:hypothetical protein